MYPAQVDQNSDRLMNASQPPAIHRENRPKGITFANRVRITSGIRGKDRGGSKSSDRLEPGNDNSLNRPHSQSSSRTSSFSSASSFSVALRPPAATAPHASNVPCKTSLSAAVTTKNAREFLSNIQAQGKHTYHPHPPGFSSSAQGWDDRESYNDRSPLRHNASHDENGRPPLQYKSILKNRNPTFDTTSPQFPLDPTIYNDDDDCVCSGFTYPFTMLTRCFPFLSCSGKDSDEDSVIID